MYENLKTLEDLNTLVASEAHEDIHLDFKASGSLGKQDKKKTEISKDVSAFANSDGGTIVYGMLESDNKASGLDGGVSGLEREWLENIITSTINPRIDGIVIHPIEISAGSYAYIVHIPRSERAPHQAQDKKFYKRFNFKSVPMEHYEIMDVMRRQSSPSLRLAFKFNSINNGTSIRPTETMFRVINNSDVPAENFAVRICIDRRIKVELPDIQSIHEAHYEDSRGEIEIDGKTVSVTMLLVRWSSYKHGLVWKGEAADLSSSITLHVPRPETGGSYLLGYQITAPHMGRVIAYRAIHTGLSSFRISDEYEEESDIARELAL
ncbi:MAG: ATPase [Candidatus Saccharibacteria bacterium]|nr:ATPase [Candidatus Saccharibacteria bacterium]